MLYNSPNVLDHMYGLGLIHTIPDMLEIFISMQGFDSLEIYQQYRWPRLDSQGREWTITLGHISDSMYVGPGCYFVELEYHAGFSEPWAEASTEEGATEDSLTNADEDATPPLEASQMGQGLSMLD